jgi:hypothetical protein
MLTSTRHGLWPSFSLNKFFILIINLTVITKSVNLAQIRKLRVWLKSAPPVHNISGVFDITAHDKEVEVV